MCCTVIKIMIEIPEFIKEEKGRDYRRAKQEVNRELKRFLLYFFATSFILLLFLYFGITYIEIIDY